MFNTEKWKNRPNKFAGSCAGCSQWVISQAGLLGGEPGGWLTVCTQCATGEAAPEAVAEKTYPLTEEQEHVLDLFKTGEWLTFCTQCAPGEAARAVLLRRPTLSPKSKSTFSISSRRVSRLQCRLV